MKFLKPSEKAVNDPQEFKVGEEVWYYFLGKSFIPKNRKNPPRRKAIILEARPFLGHWGYRVESIEKTMFPTFVGESVLKKVKK